MVRGCHKRVIYLKSTDSHLYDEVYFIVSDKAPVGTRERDFIDEANRIIRDSVDTQDTRPRIRDRVKRSALPFVFGALFSAALSIILTIIYK